MDYNNIVSNVRIYDLDESLIASNFPMNTQVGKGNFLETQAEYLKYWEQHSLPQIMTILKQKTYYSNTYVYDDEQKCVLMSLENNPQPVKVDLEDLPRVVLKGWTYNSSRGYIQSTNHRGNESYIELQNYLIEKTKDNSVIDHKNRDKFDYRRCNLRECSHSQNAHNREKLETNTSGITGVIWSNSRSRWIAVIEINGKKKSKQFREKYAAIQQRLMWESEYLGEFAPQKDLFAEYNIAYSEPSEEDFYEEAHYHYLEAAKHLTRCTNLVNATKTGNGAHAQFMTGIRVSFDLTFSNKAWVEAERYRFLEFVSSQSTMHRITKFDLDNQYNEYVDSRVIDIMKEKVIDYNVVIQNLENVKDPTQRELLNDIAKRKYLEVLYTNPAGFMLTARMTTNYRCLRNIYMQRKDHRLPEWRAFCSWIETLPYAQELLIN